MMNEKLKQDECYLEFYALDDMKDFLRNLSGSDIWEDVSISQTTLMRNCDVSRSALSSIYTEEEKESFFEKGGFMFWDGSSNYMCSEIALESIKQRAGFECLGATNLLNNRNYDVFCSVVNQLLHTLGINSNGKVLIRGNRVMAFHSEKYSPIDQCEAINDVNEFICENFADNEFKKGSYSHELTFASWSLGDHNAKIIEAYKEAWERAGLSSSVLEDSCPMVELITSDIGRWTVSLYPQIRVGNVTHHVGEPIKVKHFGGNTKETLREKLPQVFAAIQNGAENIGKLISKEINNPQEAFVAAAREVKLTKLAKPLVQDIYDEFKADIALDASWLTAYSLYDYFYMILKKDKFESYRAERKLRIREALNRLLVLDWDRVDRAGTATDL